jgi:perosamine synthetase
MYKIPLSRPSYLSYTTEVCEAVNKVIRSGFIAQGPKVEEFEQRIAEYTSTKYAVAVSSGTAGLFLCLKACGIGADDEVITTPYTFIATVFAIQQTGAKPVFCDVDRQTYNIDNKLIRSQLHKKHISQNKVIMPVDILGLPVSTDEINDSWPIILDSCESLGNHPDRPFTAQVFGLYPNKLLTTGEGGIICTNDKGLADYCRAYRNQGRRPGDTWLDSSQEGFNYRTTDLQAAIGIVQLNHIDEIIERRRKVIQRYNDNGIYLSQRIDTDKYNPFVFVIECDNRDKVIQRLKDNGIELKPYFPSVHLMKCVSGYKPGDFPVSEEISRRTLAIPYFADMTESEVDEVCKTLKQTLSQTT